MWHGLWLIMDWTYKDDFSARGIHEVALLVDKSSRKLVNKRDENFVDGRKP